MTVTTGSTHMVSVVFEPCGHRASMRQIGYDALARENSVNPHFGYPHLNSGCCPDCGKLMLITNSSIPPLALSKLLGYYGFTGLNDLKRLRGQLISVSWYDYGCGGSYQCCEVEETVIGGFDVFREEDEDGWSWGLLVLTNSGEKANWRNITLL